MPEPIGQPQRFVFPGGVIRITHVFTDQPGNLTYDIVPENGHRYRMLGIRIVDIASAGAGNRTIRVVVRNNVATILLAVSPVFIASATQILTLDTMTNFMPPAAPPTTDGPQVGFYPFEIDCLNYIRIDVINGLAGDQVNIYAYYEETTL